jgi:integrase
MPKGDSMRRKSNKTRLGQFGDYWLSKNPDRNKATDSWCRTWYDPRSQQSRRESLGTADFREASALLAKWVTENDEPETDTRPDKVLINTVVASYWSEHAENLPSARTIWNGLRYWKDFWGDDTVADIKPKKQKKFREFLTANGLGAGGMDRVLSDGRAALRHAVKWQELDSAPFIFGLLTVQEKRSRDPMGRPIVPAEMALLMDSAKSRHALAFILIACNTLARPGAIVDMRRAQFDEPHELIDLNPPGRRQTKKFRPLLKATPTLQPWLAAVTDPRQHYVSYAGKRVDSVKTAWNNLCEDAGLDDRVTPYSIRHGMAREMRKRKVPTEQISIFLGHLPKDSDATTSIYAPYEPDYCTEAVAAIEAVMKEVRSHLKRVNIDHPVLDIETLAKTIPSKTKAGIGDAKREEVRFLILSGLPHKEIMKRSGVSAGTVSLIRQEVRAAVPLYRNSESGLVVPISYLSSDNIDEDESQLIELIGGPGRTRTCDLTVMSGQL